MGESHVVGVWYSRQEKHSLGRWFVQGSNYFQRRLSIDTSQSQIRPTIVSSQCLSIWHSLPLFVGRRKRLEASHHSETNSSGHPRFAERPQYQRSSPSRSLYLLLPKPNRI